MKYLGGTVIVTGHARAKRQLYRYRSGDGHLKATIEVELEFSGQIVKTASLTSNITSTTGNLNGAGP